MKASMKRKMNKRSTICGVLSVVISVSILLAGCKGDDGVGSQGEGNTDPYNVAFVLAIANNNPVVDVSRIDEFVDLTSCPGSTYSMIEADSSPSVICDGTVQDYTSRGYSSSMLERIGESVRLDLEQKVAETEPDAPDVDLAKSLELAARTLHANKKAGQKDILVLYASGISTSGTINMVDAPLCDLDIDNSVKELENRLSFSLKGINVVWYCAGDVSGKQEALNGEERTRLTEFYNSLFRLFKAESVVFRDDLPPAGSYSFTQSVSVMKTVGNVSGLKTQAVDGRDVTSTMQTARVLAEGGMIVFDEKQIEFEPDSTKLRDPDAAVQALDYVIDYMENTGKFDLLIAGTTSSWGDDEEESRFFSEKRAAAVRDLLISQGIDQSRLHCMGCGFSSELYLPDKDENGSLIESAAAQNRRVYLLDRNSEAAAKLLEQMGS